MRRMEFAACHLYFVGPPSVPRGDIKGVGETLATESDAWTMGKAASEARVLRACLEVRIEAHYLLGPCRVWKMCPALEPGRLSPIAMDLELEASPGGQDGFAEWLCAGDYRAWGGGKNLLAGRSSAIIN